MKKSLFAVFAAAAFLAASAMAHGPPSQFVSKDTNVVSAGIAQKAPSGMLNSSIKHDMAPATTSAHGGGSGGITSVNGFTSEVPVAGITKMSRGIAHQTSPPNERMLN